MAQRVKNNLDPVTNPALFFRREGQTDHDITVRHFKRRLIRKAKRDKKKQVKLEQAMI